MQFYKERRRRNGVMKSTLGYKKEKQKVLNNAYYAVF